MAMVAQIQAVIQTVIQTAAAELGLSQDDLVTESVRQFLERQLRDVDIEIYKITQTYDVRTVAEMEERYQAGTLEESISWRDLQRLDHLEYRRDRLTELLNAIP